MELKPKKDWTDAIREKYLSELPESTSAVGWEAIGRRLHRRTVLRRPYFLGSEHTFSFGIHCKEVVLFHFLIC